MAAKDTIILYDIPSKLPTDACQWSPNVWKTRYTLNYKNIPFKTEWIEFPEIADVCKRIGAPPTGQRNGSPVYTVPFIFDPNTNRAISDSLKIARYLDEQYPDTPALIRFPGPESGVLQTEVVQAGFIEAFKATAIPSVLPFILPKEVSMLNEESQDFLRSLLKVFFGRSVEELTPERENGDWERQWAKVKKGFELVDTWYQQSDGAGSDGNPSWVLGDRISFADLGMAGYLRWIRTWLGEDSEEWKDLKSWSGGRWGTLLDRLEPQEGISQLESSNLLTLDRLSM